MLWLQQFNSMLDQVESGYCGMLSVPDLRKQFGPDFTTHTVQHYIAKNRPALRLERHGKYGWCIFRQHSQST